MLPYLEIKKDNEQEEEKQDVEVPSLIGMTVKDAKKALEEVGLDIDIKEETDKEKVIEEQLPKAGIKIKQGTSIIIR